MVMTLRLLVALVIAAALGGCNFFGKCSGPGCGSGHVVSQTRSVGNFTAVRMNAAGSLTIEQTGTDSLTVETDDNLQPLIGASVKDGTLTLSEQGCKDCSPTKLVFTVTVADLKELDFASAGSANVSKVDGSRLAVTLSGAGTIKLSGRVDTLNITSSGVGSCNADGLVAKNATVEVRGVGIVRVNASDTLDAKVSGVGKIYYAGSPKLTQSVSGVGSIQPESK
ncbi:MAG: head GIN domain-containing protein [Xanthobacteraceae bacterium]